MTTPTLQSFLGANPSAVFNRAISGFSPQRRRVFGDLYNDIYGEFMGQQAAQAGAGQMPTGDFASFLAPYDWEQKFQSIPAFQRGFSQRRVAPPTRFLSY